MSAFDRKIYFEFLLCLIFACGVVHSKTQRQEKVSIQESEALEPKNKDGVAEARLMEIYSLIGNGRTDEATSNAARLVEDLPNFQLAQLVYGDLLNARNRAISTPGDVSELASPAAKAKLAELRDESLRRVKALRERPLGGTVPSQFLALSGRSKHAVAIDTSKSRLYLFENTTTGLKLVSDYYVSVGKAGTSKSFEGDQRTPLGVYYITSNLSPKSLKDFYGSGALPINYPNILDVKRGKTGGGIWLHGTPRDQFSRAPLASDGCIVLTNPDLTRIIRTIEVRTTPVVIASELKWVAPQSLRSESKPFEDALFAWRDSKSAGNLEQVLSFYAADFNSYGKGLDAWKPVLKAEVNRNRGKSIQLKDISYLRWTDSADTMVVTFGEVTDGAKVGATKRQYWIRQGTRWKIFFEGTI